MRFQYPTVEAFEDATANFEQIQSAFCVPVLAVAPPNPAPGQQYYDTTLSKLGTWNPVALAWHYS